METTPLMYRFGDFTLHVTRGSLLRGEEEIRLRPKVYETLKYLVENPGRLIGKQELIQAVWPDSFVTDDSLVQCTVELRRALDDHDQQLLKTVARRGYLFAARVIETRARESGSPEIGALIATESCRIPLTRGAGKVDLPRPGTPLIGREKEVAEAAALLLRAGVRLLSLTGAGGAGKTRLAIAVAEWLAGEFPGGIQFVGLAAVTHPDLVSTAITKALDVQQVAARPAPELIAGHLRDSGPFLLLLDNFEQVLPAAALVAEILKACPSLKVLVTSRACLRVYGEQEFPVAPLELDSAVELFAQRAQSVRPSFALNSENTISVREICTRLDGLPLAIELAAARTRILSPTAILDRLRNRLQLLTGGPVDLPERHQNLRKTIDWSYELLNETEQKLFRRFSVFSGGATLEAAEAVCNTGRDLGMDLFDCLSSLVDNNLVQRAEERNAEARFTMLETIREYAMERLSISGEPPAIRNAHAAYCLVLAEEGNPELSPGERAAWLARCDAEIDNFRSALDWLAEAHNIDWSLRLGIALFRFWDMREHLIEGRARLEAVLHLAGTGHTKERARIALYLGALKGDFAAAERFLKESLSLYEQEGDRWGIATSLNALGVAARDRGDYAAAQENFERSLDCWRMLGDRIAAARCLHNLGNVLKTGDDPSRAREALEEATAIFEELGDRSGAAWSISQQGDIVRDQDRDLARSLYERALANFRACADLWGTARSLTDLGSIYCEHADYLAAHTSYGEALAIFAELAHRRGIARVLEGFACLAVARGEAARGLKLAAAATHLRRVISAPLPHAEQLKLDQRMLGAWEGIGEPGGREAWTKGSEMSMEQSIHYALETPAG